MAHEDRRTDREAAPRAPNHLAGETSPYLLQHAYNPVDWYPWGEEALEKARREDRPVFLSIGYSACHWCHVMERESFENEEIAAILNSAYVPIKVDREERPDLDDIYMSAVQLLAGQGGWPLSVFLTPDLHPFFGGTYFPPDDRYGRPGFRRILEHVLEVYRTRREEVRTAGTQLAGRIAALGTPAGQGLLTRAPLETAARQLLQNFDPASGGFGPAPKFPHSMGMQLLLRHFLRSGDSVALDAVTTTLDRMAAGGIYDHLGGGFHRYSTDARWLVPHFEKMLYDQALLALAYLEAWQLTRRPQYAQVVRETLDYVLREMTAPEGGFYSSQDADTEGVEGRFFVWTPEEVDAVLGPETGPLFRRAYDVDAPGNFEGRSILHRVASAETLAGWTQMPADRIESVLAGARAALLQARDGRVRPGRDDKVLASWNGLMISAFARAGRVLGEPRFASAAGRAADFVLARMRGPSDEGLLHVWKQGRTRIPGFLEDYGNVMLSLVDLYETTFDPRRLDEAALLGHEMLARFGTAGSADRAAPTADGGLYNTGSAHDGLIVRMRNAQDGSTPSGNSTAALAFLRLGRLAGEAEIEKRGEEILRAFEPLFAQAPQAFHEMLLALDFHIGPRHEVVIAGPGEDPSTRALLETAQRAFMPRAVLAWTGGDGEGAGSGPAGMLSRITEGKTTLGGSPAAYVCTGFACGLPVTTVDALERELAAGG